jgi:hypothetical protein
MTSNMKLLANRDRFGREVGLVLVNHSILFRKQGIVHNNFYVVDIHEPIELLNQINLFRSIGKFMHEYKND